MFVLDPKYGPHSSPAHLEESNNEAKNRRVLYLVGEDDVENPAETKDGVNYHSGIVYPSTSKGKEFT